MRRCSCWAGCGIAWNKRDGGAGTKSGSWNGSISRAAKLRLIEKRLPADRSRSHMALVLTLKPQERIILGGAVVRNNGAYSTQLMIETHTPILRCPDILPESDVKTPCGRIYMAIELLYIQPEQREETMKLYLTLTKEVIAAAAGRRVPPPGVGVTLLVRGGDYYRALQKMKRLLQHEKSLLESVAT